MNSGVKAPCNVVEEALFNENAGQLDFGICVFGCLALKKKQIYSKGKKKISVGK